MVQRELIPKLFKLAVLASILNLVKKCCKNVNKIGLVAVALALDPHNETTYYKLYIYRQTYF